MPHAGSAFNRTFDSRVNPVTHDEGLIEHLRGPLENGTGRFGEEGERHSGALLRERGLSRKAILRLTWTDWLRYTTNASVPE